MTTTPAPAADGSSPRTTKFSSPMPMTVAPETSYQATISTSLGDMVAFLHPNKAPQTVNNFVNLARYHYYDGLVFHRVISGFMIQGGCPEGSGRGGPGYRFADELPTPGAYEIGSLAMANAGPNTNGSQFFIVSGAWDSHPRTRCSASSSVVSTCSRPSSRPRPTARIVR